MNCKVVGVDDTIREIEGIDKRMKSVIRKSMRQAAKPWMAKAEVSLPVPSWSATLKSRIHLWTYKGRIYMWAGFPKAGRNVNGEVPDFYKAYWMNYGTLRGRDPMHRFTRNIRSNTKRKNNKGQEYTRFFERAMMGAEEDIASKVTDAITAECDAIEKDINKRI